MRLSKSLAQFTEAISSLPTLGGVGDLIWDDWVL